MTEAARDSSTDSPPQDAGKADIAPATAEPSTGGRLRAAREKLKLSVFDVARELKLQPRQIEALERDDYAIFSSPVFVRGFLRNYARLVGQDGDALVLASERAGRLPESAVSPGHAGGEATVAPPKPGLREPFDRDRDSQKIGHRGNKHGVPAVVALLLVAGGIVYYHQSNEVKSPPVAEVPAPATVAETAPPQAPGNPQESPTSELASPVAGEVPAATEVPPGVPSPQAPATDAPPVSPVTPLPASPATAVADAGRPPADKPSAPAATTEPQVSTPTLESIDPPPKPAKRTSAPVAGSASHTGDPEVRLAFSDESWVEVRDAGGKVVFSDLGRPGQERVVKGQAPFQVVVGKSSGVSLTYNSRAVDLAPYTQADVARLTLQ